MKSIAITLTASFLLMYSVFGQNCSNCSISVSGSTSLDVNLYPGNTLCISSVGEITGNIYNYGGTVCNEGIISGDYIQFNGILNNYNTVAFSSEMVIWEGTVNNYQSVNSYLLAAHGSQVTINNEGILNPAELDMVGDSLPSTSVLYNHGVLQANLFHVDTSTIYNYGSISISQNMNVNGNATFYGYGILDVAQHYYNNGHSIMYCMANIGGDLYNNGETSGPPFNCGGFNVDGSAYNNGNFGTDSSPVDLCKTSGPSGFDGSLGTIGTNVTYCSCTNTCSFQTADVNEEDLSELLIYPNPASNYITVESTESIGIVFVYDLSGKILYEAIIPENTFDIDLSGFEPGMYLLRTDGKIINFIVQ